MENDPQVHHVLLTSFAKILHASLNLSGLAAHFVCRTPFYDAATKHSGCSLGFTKN